MTSTAITENLAIASKATRVDYLLEREANLIKNHAIPCLLAVEYPGIVKNTDKALRRLGGQQSIDNCWFRAREGVYISELRRPNPKSVLHLNFRPGDITSHAIQSDEIQAIDDNTRTKNIYIIGKRYKRFSKSKNCYIYKTTYKIIGYSPFTYEFNNLCDFQSLPVDKNNPKGFVNDLGLQQSTLKSPEFYLENCQKLWSLPSQFSRFSKNDYNYQYGDISNQSGHGGNVKVASGGLERPKLAAGLNRSKSSSSSGLTSNGKNSSHGNSKTNNESTSPERQHTSTIVYSPTVGPLTNAVLLAQNDQGQHIPISENYQTLSEGQSISTNTSQSLPTKHEGIGRGRRFRGSDRKYHLDHRLTIKDIELPSEKEISEHCKVPKNKDCFDALTRLFKERPIWLFSGAEARLFYYKYDILKQTMPLVAYHVKDGPWQRGWVRYGYDPMDQKNADEAKKYQVVDFRYNTPSIPKKFEKKINGLYRQEVSKENLDSLKLQLRNYTSKLCNSSASSDPTSTTPTTNISRSHKDIQEILLAAPTDKKIQNFIKEIEKFFKFKPNIISPRKQMYYQMVDIDMPKARLACLENFSKIVTPLHKTSGWFKESENVIEKVRKETKQNLEKTVRECLEELERQENLENS